MFSLMELTLCFTVFLEKYRLELKKLYAEQESRKQKKDKDILDKAEGQTLEIIKEMEKARSNVDKWTKTYESSLKEKVEKTMQIKTITTAAAKQ